MTVCNRTVPISLAISFALSGCSTGSGTPDTPPKSARASVQLPPGEYRLVDTSGESSSVCEVPDEGPIICRGEKRPEEGTYTSGGVPVRSSSMRAPHGRRVSHLDSVTEDRPVITVSREEIRVGGRSVVALDGETARSEIVKKVSERLRTFDGARPLVVADESVPYRTLTHVGLAVGRVSEGQMYLAVVQSSVDTHLQCEPAQANADNGSSAKRWRCSAYRTPGSEGDGPFRFVEVGEMPLVSADRAGGYCDKRKVQQTVREASSDISSCWSESLERRDLDEDEAGAKLLVHWKIQLDGTTDHINIRRSTTDDEAFEKCVRDVVAEMTFPEPEGGICLINYPFHFGPK